MVKVPHLVGSTAELLRYGEQASKIYNAFYHWPRDSAQGVAVNVVAVASLQKQLHQYSRRLTPASIATSLFHSAAESTRTHSAQRLARMQLAYWMREKQQQRADKLTCIAEAYHIALVAASNSNRRNTVARNAKELAEAQCLDPFEVMVDEACKITASPESRCQVAAYIRRELYWGSKIAARSKDHRPGIVTMELLVLSLYGLRDLSEVDFISTRAYILQYPWFCQFAKLMSTAFAAAMLRNYWLPVLQSRSAYEELTRAPLLALYKFSQSPPASTLGEAAAVELPHSALQRVMTSEA